MQKQARKWPVSVSVTNLVDDIILRANQAWQGEEWNFSDPFAVHYDIEKALTEEYGADCCRIASIEAQNQSVNQVYLESAFKWLAKVYNSFQTETKANFKPDIWLELLFQARDHLLKRKKAHTALACIKKAFKLSPPAKTISAAEKLIVLTAMYPFAPILVLNCGELQQNKAIEDLTSFFPEYIAVKFCIQSGGWHWAIFNRAGFESNQSLEFKSIKWVKLAAKDKELLLKKDTEGYIIHFDDNQRTQPI